MPIRIRSDGCGYSIEQAWNLSRTTTYWSLWWTLVLTKIARIMGPTWGPPGSCRPQMGPMLAPWTLLSGKRSLRVTYTNIAEHGKNSFRCWAVLTNITTYLIFLSSFNTKIKMGTKKGHEYRTWSNSSHNVVSEGFQLQHEAVPTPCQFFRWCGANILCSNNYAHESHIVFQ